MLLTKHENQTFQNQTIYLSGQAFIGCTFQQCTLILRETVYHIDRCTFERCNWHIDRVLMWGNEEAIKELRNADHDDGNGACAAQCLARWRQRYPADHIADALSRPQSNSVTRVSSLCPELLFKLKARVGNPCCVLLWRVAGIASSMMRSFRRTLAILFFLLIATPVRAGLTADNLLLIVNKNAPDGQKLAEYYAQQRQVPDGRIVVLDLPTGDEIDVDTFDEKIVVPVRQFLTDNHLQKQVTCLVTFYGVPLRIPTRVNSSDYARRSCRCGNRNAKRGSKAKPWSHRLKNSPWTMIRHSSRCNSHQRIELTLPRRCRAVQSLPRRHLSPGLGPCRRTKRARCRRPGLKRFPTSFAGQSTSPNRRHRR